MNKINGEEYEWNIGFSDEEEAIIVIRRGSETGTVFEVRNKDNIKALFRISTPNLVYPEMEIGRIIGSTTVDENLQANSLTVNTINAPNDGSVEISSADVKEFYINGNRVFPSVNNLDSNMKCYTKCVKLFQKKCENCSHDHTDPISLGDGSDTKVPIVFVDVNYIGCMYYFTIRPFSIFGPELIKIYIPSGGAPRGWGRIDLPLNSTGTNQDRLNPYGFSNIDRGVAIGKITDYTYYDTDDKATYTVKRGVPADDNIYKVGETNFTWIKYDKVKDATTGSVTEKSTIWDTGTITFYLTGKCGRCLSIDWEWIGTNHSATYTVNDKDTFKEYIYIAGISFSALQRNTEETIAYYSEVTN